MLDINSCTNGLILRSLSPRSVMFGIPCLQLLLRNLDQFMRRRPVLHLQDNLPERIPAKPRQHLDIDVVIHPTEPDTT